MENQNDQKTPEWLRILEEESWQAELIISGLALYGSFQLPEFIYSLIDFLITHLPVSQYMVGYGVSYMLLLGISILSGFFIIHFVLRAYWIGLIGLNSVFPKGFETEGDFFSPIYVKKMATIIPKVSDTIKSVDKICSSLFAGAFVFLMMYGMFGVVLGILLLIYNFSLDYVPIEILQGIYWTLVVVIVGFVFFGMAISSKRFRYSEKVQHAYFLSSKYVGNLMTPFFFKPINQITLTFYSGYKKGKSSMLLPTAFMFIAMSLSFSHITKSNIKFLIHKGQSEIPIFQKNRVYAEFYEEDLSEKNSIVNPIIPSQKISGSLLKVFIPVFENEEPIQDIFCEPYVNDDTKGRLKNRRLESEAKIFCYQKYHQIFVNDSLYQVEFLKHDHSHNGEFGLITYLPTDHFKQGKNELRTVKLATPEGQIYDELTIPFWFSRK